MSEPMKVIMPSHFVPDRGWDGPDTTANWRRLRAEQAAQRASCPPEIVHDTLDPFAQIEQLKVRNSELEEQVKTLTAELARKSGPHLRGRETR